MKKKQFKVKGYHSDPFNQHHKEQESTSNEQINESKTIKNETERLYQCHKYP